MGPICCALDVLQGDKEVELGYLLPTLSILNQRLTELQQRSQNPLALCGPLVTALKTGINNRFEQLLIKPDAQLAAVVNPRFKLDWVPVDAVKMALIEQLKRRVRALNQASNTADQTTSSPVTSDSDTASNISDFFAQISAARKQRIRLETTGDDAGAEADRYLAERSLELSSLNCFPAIKQLYIKLNTGLPASAAVERLFFLVVEYLHHCALDYQPNMSK